MSASGLINTGMTHIFNPFWNFTNSAQDYFLFVLVVALVVLVVTLKREARGVSGYKPYLAWIRGWIYFVSCFIVSIMTGVFFTLVGKPIVSAENLSNGYWWGFTFLCTGVIYFAYFYLWPKGTLTHARELHLPSVLVFGLIWGLGEGQLFLSVWAVLEKLLSNVWIVMLVSFLIIGIFKGLWQSRYWDIYVSPEHNIPEWNGPKVLFGHVPNLICTLSFLALFGNPLLFLLFQTAGLMYSAYYMHFPAWKR